MTRLDSAGVYALPRQPLQVSHRVSAASLQSVQCAKFILYTAEAWLFDSELVLNTAKACAVSFQLTEIY